MKKIAKWGVFLVTVLFSCYVIVAIAGVMKIDGLKAIKFIWMPSIAYALIIAGLILLTMWIFKFSKGIKLKSYLIFACVFIIFGLLTHVGAINYNRTLPSMYAPVVSNGRVEITAENFKKKFNEENSSYLIHQMVSSQVNADDDILYTSFLTNGTQIQFECEPETYYIKSMIISSDDFANTEEFGYAVARALVVIDNSLGKYPENLQKIFEKLQIDDLSTERAANCLHNDIHYVYSVKPDSLNFLIQPQNY